MSPDGSQNRKPLYGALLTLGMVLLAVLIFFIQDLLRRTEASIEIVTLLPDAATLDNHSPVWVGGREVGVIKEIRFRGANTDSTERLAAILKIPRKYASEIRADSRVRMTSASLIGKSVIDIAPGSPQSPAVHDQDTLRMSRVGTLEDVMDKAMALTTDFDRLIVESRSFQRDAQRGSREMQQLQANLQQVMTGFRTFSTALANSPARVLSDPDFRAALSHVTEQNRQLRAALQGALQRAQRERSNVQPALHRLLARSDTITRITAELRGRITRSGGGLLVRAQKDSAIVKALHEATVQLDSLMAETKRNPLRFWF